MDRSALPYLAIIAAYCLMAPFRSPSTVCLLMAACIWAAALASFWAAAASAITTPAAMIAKNVRFISFTSPPRLPARRLGRFGGESDFGQIPQSGAAGGGRRAASSVKSVSQPTQAHQVAWLLRVGLDLAP